MSEDQIIEEKKLREYANQSLYRPWEQYISLVLEVYRQNREFTNSGGASSGVEQANNKNIPLDGKETYGESMKGLSCLDLGCGLGAVSRLFAKRGSDRILAIDRDASFITKAKTEEHAEKIFYLQEEFARFDGNGEKFDIVWSSYMIAYYENQKDFILKLIGLLKPNGIACVFEIDGLLSNHSPLKHADWFERFDKTGIPSYDCFAGAHMLSNAEELQAEEMLTIVDYRNLDDPELAMDGPLDVNALPYNGWISRMERLKPLLLNFCLNDGEEADKRKQDFLACLQDKEHKVKKKIKLLIVKKWNGKKKEETLYRRNTEDELSRDVDGGD